MYKRTSSKIRTKRIVKWLLDNKNYWSQFSIENLPIPDHTYELCNSTHMIVVQGLKEAGIISSTTSPIDVRVSKYLNLAKEKEEPK